MNPTLILEPDVMLRKNKVCKKGFRFWGMGGLFRCLELTFIIVSQDGFCNG